MASVTGVTLAKMEEIRDNTIVSARVANGILYFMKGDGVTEFNVGSIIRPPIDAWPVGSIFINTSATNPKTLLGVDSGSPVTFARWGMGRVMVSLDSANTRFDGSEESGGSEYVTLDGTQVPWHDHGGSTGYQSHDHTHTGYGYPAGEHTHQYSHPTGNLPNAMGGGANDLLRNNFYGPATSPAGYHDHSIVTNGVSQNHYHGINGSGGGQRHENMPPYIVVYMWKRTV